MRWLLGFFTLVALATLGAGHGLRAQQARRERRAEQHMNEHFGREPVWTTTEQASHKRAASGFLNAKTKRFYVNGSTLPDVDFDVGDSFAGNLPISDHPDESRQLYFWFFPSTCKDADKEITIWLQGGPGGASAGGLILENGPFLLQPGDVKPSRNTFAWNNLTNMVWVDQPVGTGFSVGTPNVTNEYQIAEQFMGFFKNFIDTFDMQGYKVYLTGESYGGYYIPYIANGFIDANDTQYFNFKGAAMDDPLIGNSVVQFQAPAMQFLNYWSNVFGLDSKTMAKLSVQNEKCGYPAYMERYLRFPPPAGPFPGPFGNANYGTDLPDDCAIQDNIIDAANTINPCFNMDHIFDTCPIPYSGLGDFIADFNPAGPTPFYQRADVRQAIHAPAGVTWSFVSNEYVIVGPNKSWEVIPGDESLPPAQIGLVSKMIEATNNVLIGVGGLDFLLPANGTLLVIQNMTWHGQQGFSAYPNKTLYVPMHPTVNDNSVSGSGDMGIWTSERGLTFFVPRLGGHEGPWYAPGVYYRAIQQLLGRIPDLSTTGDF